MINIIGGKFKKTKLEVPLKKVRPTSIIKRKAIFSILESYGISDKQVVIHIEKRFNYFEAFIAKFTRAPKLLRRPLDKLNSALWDLLDGKRTLFQISQIMEECYGEDIIPANVRCTASISKFIELNLVIIK